MENEQEVEKEVYEVEKSINFDEIGNQFHRFVKDNGYISLIFLLIVAISPPVIGVTTVIMAYLLEFMADLEEEDLDAMVIEKRKRVE